MGRDRAWRGTCGSSRRSARPLRGWPPFARCRLASGSCSAAHRRQPECDRMTRSATNGKGGDRAAGASSSCRGSKKMRRPIQSGHKMRALLSSANSLRKASAHTRRCASERADLQPHEECRRAGMCTLWEKQWQAHTGRSGCQTDRGARGSSSSPPPRFPPSECGVWRCEREMRP